MDNCTAESLACSARPISGKPGTYMSVASGAIAVSAPSSAISTPARRGGVVTADVSDAGSEVVVGTMDYTVNCLSTG
ncbi:hypothetical protein GCM10010320_81680 [Streptomyces caelestis]|nr:hypothetical protein GCM10010320_81680 [Streptomyces caelestis]